MAFRKIDLAAVGADEPLDAFALHGSIANDDAAYTGRPRRASHTYAAAHRPTLGAVNAIVRPLALWPLSPGCTALSVRLRCVVQDASVEVWLAAYDLATYRLIPSATTTTLTTSDTSATLTLDTTRLSGLVGVMLCLRSTRSATTTKLTYTNTTFLGARGEVDFHPGHGLSLDPSKRYIVEVTDDTTQRAELSAYPPALDLIEWDNATDEEGQCWPFYYGSHFNFQGAGEDFAVDVTLVGSLILHGYSVAESAYTARASLTDPLQPAYQPAAPTVSALHARLYQQHLRTPLHALAPAVDVGDTDADGRVVNVLGAVVDAGSASWQVLSSAYLGGYDDDQTDVDRPSAVTYTRSTLVLAGLVCVDGGGSSAGRVAKLFLRAKLYSWDTGTWDGDPVTAPSSDGLLVQAPVLALSADPRLASYTAGGLLAGVSPSSGGSGDSWHTLRGCWPLSTFQEPDGFVDDLPPLGHGLVPFVLEVEDTVTGVDRALVLEVKGSTTDTRGGSFGGRATLAALTIYTRAEVV
jgi:hypothetical protein